MSVRLPFIVLASFNVAFGSAWSGNASDILPPFEQPSPIGTTPSSPTTAAPETIDDFLEGHVGALNTGHLVFLIQRIHPQLRDYYGRETCRAAHVERIVLDEPISTVYTSDVRGCQGGTLQFGPNPLPRPGG